MTGARSGLNEQDGPVPGALHRAGTRNGRQDIDTVSSIRPRAASPAESHPCPAHRVRTRKRPGTTKYGDITLKRTLSPDKKFWEWAVKIRSGNLEYRTNGALVMYDMAGTEVGRWSFTNAWPSKWSASDLDVGSDDLMTEEITLAIEELKRDK